MARAAEFDGTAAVVRDMSSAEDTELAKLQQECQRLEAQVNAQSWELSLLRARFARYETALRGSQVTVYTQDRDLRYTSISNPLMGREIEDILGHTDEEILPPDGGAAVIALKREALASGQSRRAEVALEDGSGLRWNDLHIEPLRNEAGEIVGLTCASVDVTERKEGEAHLRLLMRELTHRSKNLLAVIQAMARQTARHAGSIDGFLNQFGARLQALAASHDLLIRESWHGASLRELIRIAIGGLLSAAAKGESSIERCAGRAQAGGGAKSWARVCTNWRSTPRNLELFRCRKGACRSPGRCVAMQSSWIGASMTVRR